MNKFSNIKANTKPWLSKVMKHFVLPIILTNFFLLSISLLKQKKTNKIKLIYLLIIFKPFCIAFCNGELVSYGENSKWIADERLIIS